MMKHWAIPYIGSPWVSGAEGPDAFDCWGFTRFVQRVHFGIELPVINIAEYKLMSITLAFKHNPERANWEVVDTPVEGDCVLLGHARNPCHIGVFIRVNSTSGVLHCAEKMGVVFQTVQNLRETGWGHFQYIRRIK